MEQRYVIKTEWIKAAALIFITIVILMGLFTGGQNGRSSLGLTDVNTSIIFGDITYQEALNLLLLGFLSGTVGGMLGMGGGVLKMVNLHILLGFNIIFARIVSLISYTMISIAAFIRYRKYNLILWDIAKMLIPSSILGVLVGVAIGNWINKDYVEKLLGIYALCAGVIVLNQAWVKPNEKELTELPKNEINEVAVSGIGIGMGLVSSIIGISGGILSTPLQQLLLNLPLKNSIANSITAAVFCSLTASAILLYYGLKHGDFLLNDVLLVSACLIPGNILGGQLGSYLTNKLQIKYVRLVFAVAAFAIGYRIFTQ